MQYVTGVNFVMTDILTTHKHWDHAGGNMELLMQARSQSGVPGTLLDADMSIYGSVLDRPHACTNFVDDGDVLTVAGGGVKVTVLHSPGHTKGSVMFLVGDAFHSQHETQRLALFTGDCLFCGGCGAPFELTNVDEALQVYDLFNDCNTWKHPVTGQTVPQDAVLVYVGHEYTAMLLKQLNHIGALRKSCKEKCNSENENFHHSVQRAYTETRQLRNTYTSDNTYRNVGDSVSPNDPLVLPACTVPSTVSIERKINPLLTLRRCDLIALKLKRCPQTSLMEAMYVSRSEEVTE
ncbi:hypothetical protein TRVL_05160 [Trypanosoma vivax]|nr:hypothetical protein TRVL_05160 [Trypanosoma vivax]